MANHWNFEVKNNISMLPEVHCGGDGTRDMGDSTNSLGSNNGSGIEIGGQATSITSLIASANDVTARISSISTSMLKTTDITSDVQFRSTLNTVNQLKRDCLLTVETMKAVESFIEQRTLVERELKRQRDEVKDELVRLERKYHQVLLQNEQQSVTIEQLKFEVKIGLMDEDIGCIRSLKPHNFTIYVPFYGWNAIVGREARLSLRATRVHNRAERFLQAYVRPLSGLYGSDDADPLADKESIPVEIVDHKEGFYTAVFQPARVGQHTIHVQMFGEDVRGSPLEFSVRVAAVSGRGLLTSKAAGSSVCDTVNSPDGENDPVTPALNSA